MQTPNDGPAPDQLQEQESQHARGSFDLRAKRAGNKGMWKVYVGIVLVLLLMLSGFLWMASFVMGSGSKADQIDESNVVADAALQRDEAVDDSLEKAQARKRLQMQKDADEKARLEALAKQAAEKPAEPTPQEETVAEPKGKAGTATPAAGSKDAQPSPALRRMAGGVIVKPSNGEARSTTRTPADQEEQDKPAAGGGEEGSLSNLGGTRFASTKAKPAPDGTYLLAHNTYARCALYTEIITDNPGLIECRLTDPLYSANGQTVLAESGARLFGEQRTTVKAGQQRVFTAWTEMEANNGTDHPVRVRLDSLGAGAMGASGTQAWIDNHWGERVGGALMLSTFQDVMAALANSTQKSSKDGYTMNNTEQNVEGMGEKMLDNTINIPPTAYILPGTVMTVIVARDIDFSTVYQNH